MGWFYMSNKPLVPEAKRALNKFKLETAKELHIEETTQENHKDSSYMGNLTSKESGSLGGAIGGNIGGAMMRKIIEEEELKIASKYENK